MEQLFLARGVSRLRAADRKIGTPVTAGPVLFSSLDLPKIVPSKKPTTGNSIGNI